MERVRCVGLCPKEPKVNFRHAVRLLRKHCPLQLPVKVRRTSNIRDLGEAWRAGGDDAPVFFQIKVNSSIPDPTLAVWVLCHEWAHCMVWGCEEDDHGPLWGVALAKAYREVLE